MSVRIDKWLWSIRIYKSRSKASDACRSGHVLIDGEKVKASATVSEDQVVTVKKEGFDFQYKVIKTIEKRVSYTLAIQCYEDLTTSEELNKYKLWFSAAKGKSEHRDKGMGRPTKKQRREIERFKDL